LNFDYIASAISNSYPKSNSPLFDFGPECVAGMQRLNAQRWLFLNQHAGGALILELG
jgi:hypothetical protein